MGAVRLTARAELRRRWAALLVLTLVVGFAGAAVHASLAASNRARTAFDRFVASAPQANIDVELEEPGTPALVDRVADIPGVEGVQLSAFVAVLPEGQGIPYVDGIAFARIAGAGMSIGGDVGVAGDDLDPEEADEIVLNPAMADELGAGPGDELTLVSLTEETANGIFEGLDVTEPDGPEVRVRVAGVRRIPEDISDAPDPILVVSRALTERKDISSFNGLMGVRAEPGRVDEVVDAISELAPGARVTPSQNLRQRIQSSLDVQAATLLAVAVAAAVAGAAMVAQLVLRLVRASREDDGVRVVLGMTRGQRAAIAALVVAPVAIGGAVLTLVGGVLAAPLAVTGLAEVAEPDAGPWFDPLIAALVTLSVVLLVVVVALFAPMTAALDEDRSSSRVARFQPTSVLSPAAVPVADAASHSAGSTSSRRWLSSSTVPMASNAPG